MKTDEKPSRERPGELGSALLMLYLACKIAEMNHTGYVILGGEVDCLLSPLAL